MTSTLKKKLSASRSPAKKNLGISPALPARLAVGDLFAPCPAAFFKGKTTSQLKESNEIIAQERAIQAIRLGLGISKPGYNIYVAGYHGTGKTSVIKSFLEQHTKNTPPPPDWIYVHDFHFGDVPREISLPAGKGWQFVKDMERAIKVLRVEIPATLQSKSYEHTVNLHLSKNADLQTRQFKALEKRAKKMNFQLKSTKLGIETIPIVDGRALSEKEYFKLSEKERGKIELVRGELEPQVLDFARQVRSLELESKTFVYDLQREYAKAVVQEVLAPFAKNYAAYEEVLLYLGQVQEEVVENLADFFGEGTEEESSKAQQQALNYKFRKYRVNLFVDNRSQKNAPIVIENNPNYYNLFGRIEKNIDQGVYYSDYTMIKSGAMHRANGGFLVLEAGDVLKVPAVWETLKRCLRSSQGFIEDIGEQLSLFPTTGLRPRPIPLNVKVVMIGTDEIYHLLHELDEEFGKVFKIKADFDYKMPRTPKNIHAYASFLAARCRKEKLLHFDPSGLCAMVEYGARMVEEKDQLTTQFGELKDLSIEADYLARQAKSRAISRKHVEQALEQKFFRVNLMEQHLQESLKANDILITLDGQCVGQVNGLAVYDIGTYAFGKPLRITCTTSVNDEGIVNIERSSKLSGTIHDKGVQILTSYLQSLLAREYALGLSASVCFEQSYSMIDGDSGSIAELTVILSAMAGIPIKQNLAMTGSLNQMGEVQPIGGINEKIEGFYRCCEVMGRSKRYGVIFPAQNVANLMLHRDIREAVRAGKLDLYPVRYFWQAFELATAVSLGIKHSAALTFAKGSVLALVQKKLKKLHEDELKEGE